jgi:hypothetical protein
MTTSSNGKVAVIDADIIQYQIAYSKKKVRDLSKGFSSGVSSSAESFEELTWDETKAKIDDFMQTLRRETLTSEYMGFFSPPRAKVFRTALSSIEYKGNRPKTVLPRFFHQIREYFIEEYGFYQLEHMEADDALTIFGSRDFIMCSKDKDIKQKAGRHWNWETKEMRDVSNDEGYRLLWAQVLSGDSTDNIMGCGERVTKTYKTGPKKGGTYIARKGIGPKAAKKLVDEANLNTLPSVVLTQFVNAYGLNKGIIKYHEAFRLIFLLRSWPKEEPLMGTKPIPWITKQIEEEDDEEW